ncbi:MAG: DNA gyrase subunit A [Candidatus Hydrothermales bacterium]
MTERLINAPIEEEMSTSYIDYAMSVIVGRALPDVRDGLKPVHRRILYSMYESGLLPTKPFKKSATVVGDVLGKFHPHGDMAVYDALVRMAQDFSLRYPLIEGQGNFGSIDGDPPAAYRYTEVRLSKIALEMLKDLDKNTVDFVPNFDGRLKEPVVLPSLLPNLLVNGSTGIAVGMSTNIPPHNLSETVDALIYLIDNPDCKDEDLFEIIKGPDFPTGGLILGKKGIHDYFKIGRGQIVIRGKYYIEEKGRKKIIFTEIPYLVNKASLLERIADLIRDKKIEGIQDLRDESDRDGLRIVIELKKNISEKLILNQLFKYTQLQDRFNVIMLSLVENEPKVLSLREILNYYLRHREEVTRRKTEFLLKKAQERAHILDGLKVALKNIDEVIKIIKHSKDPKEAGEKLRKVYKLTELQTQAILEMRLQTLTKLEISKIEEEYEKIIKDIQKYKRILEERKILFEEIKKELIELKEKHGDKRKTEILDQEPEEIDIESLIKKEKILILLSKNGYIKRIQGSYLKTKSRGTQGQKGVLLDEDDFPEDVFYSFSHDYVLFVSNKGKVYSLKAYEIPESGLRGKGKPVNTILNLPDGEKIVDMIPISEFKKGVYLFLITRKGIIKKTDIELFKNAGKRGITGQILKEKDETIKGLLVTDEDEVILLKENGLASRIISKAVRPMGRSSYGIIGIKTSDAECISGAVIKENTTILVVTEKGYGKRFKPEEIPAKGRGAKGVIVQKVNEKTGKAIWLKAFDDKDHLVLLTSSSKLLRQKVEEIPLISRATRGVRLIKVEKEDKVVGCAKIPYEEEMDV